MIKDESGVVAIITAVVVAFVLIGIAALAVDIGRSSTAKNELQNASDAGALAGAGALYDNDGRSDPNDYEVAARETIEQNLSMNKDIVIESIERGHWSFQNNDFIRNESNETLGPVNLWEFTFEELDDPDTAPSDYVNAVKVRTSIEVNNFFATGTSTRRAEAIAYLGFASSHFEVDFPMAICDHSLRRDDDGVNCDTAIRTPSPDETAMWTHLDSCDENMNRPALENVFSTNSCDLGDQDEIVITGAPIGTSKGEISAYYQPIRDCWVTQHSNGQTMPWSVRMPVIRCETSTCNPVVGMVKVDIIWMTPHDAPNVDDPQTDTPRSMDEWSCDLNGEYEDEDIECWEQFVDHFEIANGGETAEDVWESSAIYFRPSCELVEPDGTTGTDNFGIAAKIPVLVD